MGMTLGKKDAQDSAGSSEQLHLQKKLYSPFKAPPPLAKLAWKFNSILIQRDFKLAARNLFSREKFLTQACFHPTFIQLISSSGFFANLPRRRRSKSQSFKRISSINFLCISACKGSGNSKTICAVLLVCSTQ